ncbi:DUF192 domain-containing protein [Candidatus Woesearchaeota archaeon]|nr:DUF192 domain-containing protein [Candidatus Woesearchaeota archaeon]
MIKNSTKNMIIMGKLRLADGILSKSIGLMFSKRHDYALIFRFGREKFVPLHMLFVFRPIDVLFLGKNRRVVDKKENFRPFAFYNPKKKAMYVIEIPKGTIKRTKTGLGDKISWKFK